MDFLLEGIKNITWQQAVMYVVGIILITGEWNNGIIKKVIRPWI